MTTRTKATSKRGLAAAACVGLWLTGSAAAQSALPGIVYAPTTDERRLAAAVAHAAAEPQSGRRPSAPASSPGSSKPPLLLEQVFRLIEDRHPKLRGSVIERQVATAKRIEKQGAFDPILSISTDYLRYNSSSKRGKVSEAFGVGTEVNFLTRSGIKFFVASNLNLGATKSPLSATGDAGEYLFGLKVPLFRDFRVNAKSIGERQAFLGETQADIAVTQTRLELFRKAADDYWDWVAAKRRLDVARDLLRLAEIRNDAIRQRTIAGDLPPIDAVEAEQEVQRRQAALAKAERDFQKAQFKLSLSLWLDDVTAQPPPDEGSVLDVSLQLEPTEVTEAEIQDAIRLALQRRPELQAIAVLKDITRLDLDLARNQRRPILDFALAPGRDVGLGGIGTTLKAGFIFELPLRQRTADGRIAQAQLKLQKLELEERALRQQIITEINDTASAINAAWRRYLATKRELEAAIVLERGENQRFLLGDSSLFLVNQRERATAEARNKLIDVQAEYEQARAALRLATMQF
ncbi:MAG: TolC family protein [Chloracidobacterium sp.]|nr:TolC family protein [Chloracidobacterium sp.]MDW8218394.1 TolC family protein [Acidobacteriota bacterium]